MRKRKKRPLFLVKLLNYEYWPFWLFFLPLVPYWIYLSLRARSFTYFTAANPGIEHGGVFGESKIDILRKIDAKYRPTTFFFSHPGTVEAVLKEMEVAKLDFPVILKPNVGERGMEVEKINDQSELTSYLAKNQTDFIVQEFVDFEIELGVLYYRFPNGGKSGITSVVSKEFLSVTGDGRSTVAELIAQEDRGRIQLEALTKKFGERLNDIPPRNAYQVIEPIGNHSRGTKFLSGMNLLNDQLIKVFDDVARNIEGFNFGRFDLKVKSLDDLYLGENVRILELNGVTSEPAHIYDPAYSLWRAYLDAARNMKMMFYISQANRRKGVQVTPFFEMLRLVREHFGRKRKLQTVNLRT